jgi:uncharacterized protein (DUF1810 family)
VANARNDSFNLKRFVVAQADAFDEALSELQEGCKRGHWMWFIFPQIKGLGDSPTSRKFAISSRAEAQAYLLHPVLGSRLVKCTRIVSNLQGLSAHQIFGYPDDLKFRSSMTLFSNAAAPDNTVFEDALSKYFCGEPDKLTLERLQT